MLFPHLTKSSENLLGTENYRTGQRLLISTMISTTAAKWVFNEDDQMKEP